MPSRSLSTDDLTAARRAYEQGATFAEIGQRYGLSVRSMRRLLRTVGVEPRPRGVQARELPVALILANHEAGMSAREIARKHGIGSHHQVTALLREHGREPHHRGRTKGNRAIVLGEVMTNRQAAQRRRPPIKIPVRTPEERRVRWWTKPELEAIAQGISAGRSVYIPRGRSGRSELMTWHEHQVRTWQALHGKAAA